MAGVKTEFLVENRSRAGVRERVKEHSGEGISTERIHKIVRRASAKSDAERARLVALARAGDAASIEALRLRYRCVVVPINGGVK